ncbi:MAG: hypothetical protein DHS20C14_19760 [Phycisphaeraceae bacterium]|nr:MAG: hypothetical protein DHS20C14_19760 [Phycisphaeraceae bacterium]
MPIDDRFPTLGSPLIIHVVQHVLGDIKTAGLYFSVGVSQYKDEWRDETFSDIDGFGGMTWVLSHVPRSDVDDFLTRFRATLDDHSVSSSVWETCDD